MSLHRPLETRSHGPSRAGPGSRVPSARPAILPRPVRGLLAALGCLGVLALGADTAEASGFALFEQSVPSAGTAYAGAASRGADASILFFNPAGLTLLDHDEAIVATHALDTQFEFTGQAVLAPGNPIVAAAGLGGEIVPGRASDNAGTSTLAPNLYYSHVISPRWRFGLGVSAPFGLETEYDPDWVGRYLAIDSSIVTSNVNPTLAFRVGERVSLGFGVDALYADTELSQAIDTGAFGSLVLPLGLEPADPALDGSTSIEGNDWGFGYNLGLLVEPDPTLRFGLAYRSSIDLELTGDADFRMPRAAQPLTASGLFRDTAARASLDLPETATASAYWEPGPTWAVMADASWTRWSRLESLVIEFENEAQPNLVTPLGWDDSFRYSLGAVYGLGRRLELRIGAAWDEAAVSDPALVTPRVPDADRTWVTVGLGYELGGWDLDLAIAHLEGSTRIDNTGSTTPTLPIDFHRLTGTYDSSVDILSVQAQWSFGAS